MKIRKTAAGLAALSMVLSVSACSSTDTAEPSAAQVTTTAATEWTGDSVEVEEPEETLDVDISGKELVWLGMYDLNPTNDSPERSPELALFEDTYGAKIKYMPTTSDQRFDDLATNILGGTSPDIFAYEWRTFPYDISKGQYQPVDSLVDWSDPKWASVKDTADSMIWKGEHYIAPTGYSFNDTQVLMYNKTTIENEGFEDPYELYRQGKWTWSAFVEMMKSYVENHPGEEIYGIGGWWANAFVFTAGETMVTYDGTTFGNNLRSAKIEQAQETLKDIKRNNLIKTGWIGPEPSSTTAYSSTVWAHGRITALPSPAPTT